jgi:hypothetical protein
MEKIKEGDLLTYLANADITDGSFASLEEIQLQRPELLRLLAEQWPQHVARIKAVIKK